MKQIELYWNNFITENPLYSNRKYTAWHFCNDKESANNLANLVKEGIKKGTSSLEKSYTFDTEPIPREKDISIIINWDKEPKCIIKTIKINKYKFKDVPEKFALIEGEGDRSINYWKKIHLDFFTKEADGYGFKFNDELVVICEEFRVIYI